MSEANRECRDVLCCLIFIANVIAMIYLTFYGYLNGDPYYVYRGTADGKICGQSAGVENYPYMYMYNPIPWGGDFDETKTVCVKECPYMNGGTLTQIDCLPATNNCQYDVTFDSSGTPDGVPQ